ncbi:NnrS family protein [Azospirillum sp. ST 5-10]|uniref:NnrS family protein n=1 Tax=unclassified Azospirillum TaxID=2630922 RepID=UPI003F49D4DE
MTIHAVDRPARPALPTLFHYGFRPFFLLAGLSAPALVGLWLAVLGGLVPMDGAVAPVSWHAHEMLFGFAGAAIAGFLLTAVPSWTASTALSGAPLAALVALWLAGRVASLPAFAAGWAATAVDLAFLPAVGLALAVPLVRAGKARNTAFLALLALMTAGNLLIRLEWLGVPAGSEAQGRALAIGVVLMMIAVIGGRIVPAFTRNALRARGDATAVAVPSALDTAALALTAAVVAVDVVLPASAAAGALALAAALAHAVRLARWRGDRTLHDPLLWILHVGYAWVPVALGLKAAWLLGDVAVGTAWLHALTAGSFATMILAVMSRATLGHTGRPLTAPRATAVGFVLLTLAAVARVVAPVLPGVAYTDGLAAAGLLWTAAFVLFLVDYAPILLRPRADGRPG